jgi:glycosyltransferase involved in cell wall biosynthesis
MTAVPVIGKPRHERPLRVAHLVSHPIQYYIPLYRALSKKENIDLTVFFYTAMGMDGYFDRDFGKEIRWDIDLTSGYRSVFLADSGVSFKPGFFQLPNWKLLWLLLRGRYDVIWIHGYQHTNTLAAKIISLICGYGFLIREDQTLLEPRSLRKHLLKKLVFTMLFSGKRAGALYTGLNSRKHFQHYGVSDSRLFPAVHSVDDAFFSEQALSLASERSQLRLSWGITDDAPVVLFAGKLIEKKQPLLLLEAFGRVASKRACWLLFVGDGPLAPDVRQACTDFGIADRVILAGFLNQQELPMAYIAADLFVLPSSAHETWGLVVNEAMHFGLPIIASDHVGCVPDLVHEAVNGFVFPAQDLLALSEALQALIDDRELRIEFSKRSVEIIKQYTVENCAESIKEACLSICNS